MCTKIHVKWLDGGRGIYTFKSFVKVWPNPKGVEQHFDLNVNTVHWLNCFIPSFPSVRLTCDFHPMYILFFRVSRTGPSVTSTSSFDCTRSMVVTKSTTSPRRLRAKRRTRSSNTQKFSGRGTTNCRQVLRITFLDRFCCNDGNMNRDAKNLSAF